MLFERLAFGVEDLIKGLQTQNLKPRCLGPAHPVHYKHIASFDHTPSGFRVTLTLCGVGFILSRSRGLLGSLHLLRRELRGAVFSLHVPIQFRILELVIQEFAEGACPKELMALPVGYIPETGQNSQHQLKIQAAVLGTFEPTSLLSTRDAAASCERCS